MYMTTKFATHAGAQHLPQPDRVITRQNPPKRIDPQRSSNLQKSNRVLRKLFGSEREKIRGDRRKLLNPSTPNDL
jgi:hypothetical protein